MTQEADVPADATKAAQEAQDAHRPSGLAPPEDGAPRKRSLSKMMTLLKIAVPQEEEGGVSWEEWRVQ